MEGLCSAEKLLCNSMPAHSTQNKASGHIGNVAKSVLGYTDRMDHYSYQRPGPILLPLAEPHAGHLGADHPGIMRDRRCSKLQQIAQALQFLLRHVQTFRPFQPSLAANARRHPYAAQTSNVSLVYRADSRGSLGRFCALTQIK